MSSIDSITITSVSTVNQIEITSTSGITVTTVGTQGLAGPSAIMQKGVDATTIGSSGNGTFLVYDHANSQWTSSGSASVSNLTVELQKLRLGGTGATVVSILDEDNMSSDSATSLATQQSIKAYVESRVGIDNLAALLASGNTTGGTNIVVSANDDITFTDTSKGLFGNNSDLQIYHDGTNSYIANSQGALKVATETSGITVNIGHTTSTVAIGDDLTVAGNQSITGTLGVTGTITGSLTGNVTGQVSDISNFTTANITENTNLYYTNERVDDQVNSLLVGGTGIILTYDDNAGTLTIDGQIGDITSVVAGDGLSGGGSSGDVTLTVNVDNSSIEINSDTLRVKASGITNDMLAGSITNSKLANADFTINSNSLVLGNSLTLDTDDIGEGSNNQYYTTSRANSDFDTRLATKTTDNLTEGSSRLYFTTARANTSIDNRVTKAFVDNLGVEASSVTANSVALGTDTTGNYIQTVSGTANKITVSGSGSESADITLTLPDDVQIADSLTVAGNLTVNGTLTSLDTTNLDIEDNLFQLNAGLTGSPVNDSGMLINRGNQNNGIFMWDESVDKFTMGLTTANGSATGNITLASLGTLVVNVEGNLTGAVTGNSSTATTLQTPRSIALTGDVSASAVNFDGSGNITLTTTIEANSIALGTDTVGNYVASITGGTGVTITGGTGETSTPSVAIGQAVGTTDDVTFNQVTADIIGNIEGATEFSANAGEALTKGDAVYISGVSGNKPVVSKADSDDANKMPSFGLAKADANLNADVSVVTFGTLAGLNTSSFSVGDTLYISTTAGGLTATPPTGESSLIQNIGKVQRSHASAGSIKVGGAGRTNATPNLNDGKIFLGNGSNQSVSTTLDSSVVPENTNLYYTDARVQAVSINNLVEDTTPQLGGDLASNGNDILFGDSDKAIFGADSDLQIYHNGSNSLISDSGSGSLIITANQLAIKNAGNSENVAIFNEDSDVRLFHDSSIKLATTSTGIDVTGTATMDGLVVSSTTPVIDVLASVNEDASLRLRENGTGVVGAEFTYDGGDNELILKVGNNTNTKRLSVSRDTGDISFYEDTGTTAKFFWDASAESLGIGTDSPTDKLQILDSGNLALRVESSGASNQSAVWTENNSGAINGMFMYGSSHSTYGAIGAGEGAFYSNTNINIMSDSASGTIKFSTGSSGGSERFHIAADGSLSTPTLGTSNVRFGVNAGNSITSGSNYNVVVGDEAGTALTTGDSNIAIGYQALSTEDAGSLSTAIGFQALKVQDVGAGNALNVAVGYQAGAAVTTGINNTLIGGLAGDALTDADFNTAFGYAALSSDTLGSKSTALGYGSLVNQNFTSATDTYNTAVGHHAGYAITTGVRNTLIGALAGDALTDTDNNTAIGYSALSSDTLGINSIAIGFQALKNQNFTSATDAHNVAIGVNAGVNVSTGQYNTLIGNFSGDAITTSDNNTAVGYASLSANTTGAENTAVGANALDANTTGNANVAVGQGALDFNTTGLQNTAVGHDSMRLNTTGQENVAVGKGALNANTTASNNTAVGRSALSLNTTGTSNVAMGYNSLLVNTTGNQNTAIGMVALDANTTGSDNVALGYAALTTNTTASNNTAIGRGALQFNTTGSNNTAIGLQAGVNHVSGNYNTYLGSEAGRSAAAGGTGAFNTALGYASGYSLTSGGNNTFVGLWSGFTNSTGASNVAIGGYAMQFNTTASNNTAVGYKALNKNTTGDQNVAVGRIALTENTTGNYNVGIGPQAIDANTTGSSNVGMGYGALGANTTANNNTGIGHFALIANTTGASNTAVGAHALDANTTGGTNTALGQNALGANTTGNGNVAIGYQALIKNTTANYNVAIGENSQFAHLTGTNNVAVGAYSLDANIDSSNNTAIGDSSLTSSTEGQNTALGYAALTNLTTGTYNIGIGYNANSSTVGASGQCTLGDGNISNLRCNDTTISSLSDSRDKTDVINSPYGLEFINTVRPVQFKWETRDGNVKDGSTRIGFIAQELLTACDGNNDVLDLVLDDNPDKLEAKYGNLLPVLVKALQEADAKIEALTTRITTLEG